MKNSTKFFLITAVILLFTFSVVFIIPLPERDMGEVVQSYSDSFENGLDNYHLCAGEQSIEDEKLKIISNGEGSTVLKNYTWCGATYEFDVDFNEVIEWCGVQFNKENIDDTRDQSGYLFYIRDSGNCRIYSADGGVIAKGYIPPIPKKAHIKIVTEIGKIQVYLNNIKFPIISVEDDTFSAGYFSFSAINTTTVYFDNLKITQYKSDGVVKKLSLKKNITSVEADMKTKIDAVIYPFDADTESLNWKVTDLYGNETTLATIDENGVLKSGSQSGAVKVSVECNGIYDETNILIKGTSAITADKDAKIMKKGSSIQMSADKSVLWSVLGTDNNPTKLATIDENGLLTANEKGTVKVIATDENGDTETYVMTIGEISTNGVEIIDEMNYAFFAHYVPELSCDKNGVVITDKEVLANTFNAEVFADEMAKMGVQYVVFTAFHFRMVCLYPSDVMKEWGMDNHYTQRDLIGEMIDAVQSKGINVALYVHPYDGYDFATIKEAQITGWGNTTVYPRPDYASFDHEKWNKFIREVYGEILDRYGDRIFGIWSDEGNNQEDGMSNAVDFPALIKMLKSKNENLVTFQNVYYSQYGMDIAIKEYWHWGEFASTDGDTWISYKNKVPAIVMGNNWWSEGTNDSNTVTYSPESLFRYQILQASCGERGGIQWAAGPMAEKDGGFQNGVSDTFELMNCYMNPICWTVKGVKASSAYPTADGTSINNIEAFVSTESQDGTETYIHILKKDSKTINGNSITIPLPADNRKFSSAYLAINGKEVDFKIKNGNIVLTLPDGECFNSIDTVITLL